MVFQNRAKRLWTSSYPFLRKKLFDSFTFYNIKQFLNRFRKLNIQNNLYKYWEKIKKNSYIKPCEMRHKIQNP